MNIYYKTTATLSHVLLIVIDMIDAHSSVTGVVIACNIVQNLYVVMPLSSIIFILSLVFASKV